MLAPREKTSAFQSRRLLLCLGLLAFCSLGSSHELTRAQRTPRSALGIGVANKPVILLTGFEPFGKEKAPNSSWEAIKGLDGQEWKGYRLVARQLPVVWGAPLQQIPELYAEHRPVAIFSFGEGAKGYFTIEGKGKNDRCKPRKDKKPILDNRGELAPTPTILKDGPEFLPATIACRDFAGYLAEKGYPIKVSRDAGGYLCDEALYSLELLKSTKKLKATVMFCHVPPFKSKVGGEKVTAEYVQGFVKEVLETWYLLKEKQVKTSKENQAVWLAQAQGQAKARDRREGEVTDFVKRYFRTWSEQDMKGYEQCFLPDAAIQFIDDEGLLHTSMRGPFVASQRDYHRRSPVRTVEVPVSIDIRFEGKLARAVVYWKLTAGQRREYGYDHFTLVKHRGEWRIVNLAFYGVEKENSKE